MERLSPCKVNLLLNILGKRPDGFHELETLFFPVPLHDRLTFDRGGNQIELTCNVPELPVDSGNLVYRAAERFVKEARVSSEVRIHLEKNLPLAAGLGAGSANAAVTLLALNEIFDRPLSEAKLLEIASTMGSDIPFFFQDQPALGIGRGEKILPVRDLRFHPATHLLLAHPGFGISTAWAYQRLAAFPGSFHGAPGRAAKLIDHLKAHGLAEAQPFLFNSLEAPAFHKYPVLDLYKEFMLESGALAALMSGSGSTVFCFLEGQTKAEAMKGAFQQRFGPVWTAIVPLPEVLTFSG